ncbi:MAG: pyridoxamine 5'-phosphate oxidase [Planctomycetes bacterium]|nr:pyridoxamine 5'-phosphate oxidase [Planctomycetota bacterium]
MVPDDLSKLRIEYGDEPFRREDLPADPVELFREWLRAAAEAKVSEPNGMALATVDAGGQPHCRIVLLKQIDARGFAFFTNRDSDKGAQLAFDPRAAATFWWPAPRNRQVRVLGSVVDATAAECDHYFTARPRRAQLCSAASPQSKVVQDRAELERLVDELEAVTAGGPVVRPAHWGGYVLRPAVVEFWQGRDGRLHDRFRYTRHSDEWTIERLAP